MMRRVATLCSKVYREYGLSVINNSLESIKNVKYILQFEAKFKKSLNRVRGLGGVHLWKKSEVKNLVGLSLQAFFTFIFPLYSHNLGTGHQCLPDLLLYLEPKFFFFFYQHIWIRSRIQLCKWLPRTCLISICKILILFTIFPCIYVWIRIRSVPKRILSKTDRIRNTAGCPFFRRISLAFPPSFFISHVPAFFFLSLSYFFP